MTRTGTTRVLSIKLLDRTEGRVPSPSDPLSWYAAAKPGETGTAPRHHRRLTPARSNRRAKPVALGIGAEF
jgi:hypothetical protein